MCAKLYGTVSSMDRSRMLTWTATAGWHTIMAFMTVGGSAEKENPYNNRCSKEFFFAERKA